MMASLVTRRGGLPLASALQRSLVEYALEHAEGTKGLLFTPWANVRRDLIEACDRARIDPVSPNDLRGTCATWLRQAGAPPDPIALVMGHADTRMVERVYGRRPTEDLARRLASAIGESDRSALSTGPEHSSDKPTKPST